MTGGMPPRAFAAVPGAAPAMAAAPAAAPAAPPAPGQPGPDGSIDLLAYGRANNIPHPGSHFDETANKPGGVDLLAWGPDNGVFRPGQASGMTPAMAPAAAAAPAVAQQPPAPPPPPQTERVNPLAGDVSAVAPGQSAPFTPPPALHVGGQGSYMRQFSNPHSAGMYESYVKGLFGSKPSPQRTPLTRAPAPLSYAGD